jgi:chromate transporter
MADELGLPALVGGLLGFAVAAWATFLPSFGFVLVGAPSVEQLRHNRRVAGALAAVTAAVVGVIGDLALWFTMSVLFGEVDDRSWGPFTVSVPEPASLDGWALVLAASSLVLVFGFRWSLFRVLAAASTAGLALALVGLHP